MDEQKKTSTVPYLSGPKMDKLLQLVSERSLSNISASYFKTYGFGEADSYLAMNTLRFLGLIDESDKPTDDARKFQLKGDARNTEVEPIVRKAYSALFDTADKAHKLEKDDLTNEFMHSYSLSSRIAKSAVPAFLKLCEFAGIIEPGTVPTRTRQPKSAGGKKIVKTISKIQADNTALDVDAATTVVPFAEGKVKLLLPTEIVTKAIFEGELNDDIKQLTGDIKKFVTKHVVASTVDDDSGIEEQAE